MAGMITHSLQYCISGGTCLCKCLGKKELKLLKLHPEKKTAKSTVFKLEKQTILLLSFPVIDLEYTK